jgi:hypothetical protein
MSASVSALPVFLRSYLTLSLRHASNLLLRSTPLLVRVATSPEEPLSDGSSRYLSVASSSGKLQIFMQPRLHVSETQSLYPGAVMSMAPQRPRLRLLRSQTLFCDDGRHVDVQPNFFLRPTARSFHGSHAIVKLKLHITTASLRPTLFKFMLTDILDNTKNAERIEPATHHPSPLGPLQRFIPNLLTPPAL